MSTVLKHYLRTHSRMSTVLNQQPASMKNRLEMHSVISTVLKHRLVTHSIIYTVLKHCLVTPSRMSTVLKHRLETHSIMTTVEALFGNTIQNV
jgi:hypothetical protein